MGQMFIPTLLLLLLFIPASMCIGGINSMINAVIGRKSHVNKLNQIRANASNCPSPEAAAINIRFISMGVGVLSPVLIH